MNVQSKSHKRHTRICALWEYRMVMADSKPIKVELQVYSTAATHKSCLLVESQAIHNT